MTSSDVTRKKLHRLFVRGFFFLSGQIFASLHFVIMINEDFEAKMEDSSEGWSINVCHGWGGRVHSTEVAFGLLTQKPQVRLSAFLKKFSRYFLMLLRLINGTS